MPQVELLKIFLASPSDVSRERDYVEEVVEEINRTTALSKGVRLEVVRSEKNAYPSFGQGGQAALNSQIGNMEEYELFVGIMWNRLGTPTPRAESGTVEEYERAVAAFEKDGKPDIWFYFREAGANLNEEKLEQRGKVLAFKKKVQGRALTHDYEKPSDFRERFRQGLSLWLENTKANSLSTVEKKSSTPNSPSTKATVQSVTTSGNWILLNNNYYLAKSLETQSDGTISVQITTNDLEEQANLKDLKHDQFPHYSQISYAYQEEASITEVKDVILTSTGGKNLFCIALSPIKQSQENLFQDITVGSNNGKYYSADEIAEMRVKILLLNDDSLLSNQEDYLRVDSLINCSAGGKLIEPINFAELWKKRKRQKEKFLRIARLTAVYELKMSGIVEHILELKLGPIKNHLMTVEFRGTRRSRYKNKETKVIEVKGNCSLRD
ncbi:MULTISPECIES: hypothetical protein [unclassified Moorena]|uniref:DUF4062 domain-containing protein n=1 Tax=unclassified Moorena TaxID=2683338 RepID=UPI0013B813ED|nr:MULTISPECIES: hypothetical protein [unclassified Moorena]NEQ07181.1 hypothetical protein [Moorena sp. SIO4E2]NER92034.1 hypothetical protein [Moorena sp. SIO3A2]NET68956.1 hypothetical protein [Moorena sp. SIO1G6]